MSWWDTPAGNYLLTFLVAMVPVLELRGAIPFGVARGLGIWQAIGISVAGNLLPVPFIILFIRQIFTWLRSWNGKFDALVTRLEAKAESKRATVERYAFWGLVILVAIPLPGTGAWTGALIAALLNLRVRQATPAIFVGVCIAAAIMSVGTYAVINIV